MLLSFEPPKKLPDGSFEVKLQFAFRVICVSGYKWNHFEFTPPEVPVEAQQAAVQQVQSILNEFTSPEFLTAVAHERAATINNVLGAESAQARL